MTIDKFEAARRLIKAATGEEYGDGILVANMGIGYASSRYGTREDVWVLGNWNNKTVWNPETNEHEPRNGLTRNQATVPGRLFDALERIGVEGEWLDEWQVCIDCQRLIRTEADSYSFQLEAVWVDCEGYRCSDCALEDVDTSLIEGGYIWKITDGYVEEPESSRAVSFCDTSDLEEIGFTKWAPGDPQSYESGWHPGQTDTPQQVAESIAQQSDSDCEIVFYLDETSQFYVGFSAWIRPIETDDDSD